MPVTATETEIQTSPARLEAFCIAALKKIGMSEADARTTAEVLVTTDTWGVHTHGVKSLRHYIRRLTGGGLNARGKPTVVAEGPAWARIDGQSSIAMVTSVKAMKVAIAKAKECGIAYSGVFNTCHFGAAGYYAAMAAEEKMFAIAMANDAPSVIAPGAKGRVVGNNPLAFAIPRKNGKPIVLDMALSTVAGGKVAAAHALNKPIPSDWIVDVNGNPSTNPTDFLIDGGALTPMAGHKGYGLAVVVETLSGLLPGGSILGEVLIWQHAATSLQTGHGAAFIALDVTKLMPAEQYFDRVEQMAEKIHSVPKKSANDRVLLPGEREWEHREQVLKNGLVLPADVVQSLRGLCDEVGGLDLDSLLN
jgi:LDH2 family malate/lactate/ureidoglycolate dehydrogenase